MLLSFLTVSFDGASLGSHLTLSEGSSFGRSFRPLLPVLPPRAAAGPLTPASRSSADPPWSEGLHWSLSQQHQRRYHRGLPDDARQTYRHYWHRLPLSHSRHGRPAARYGAVVLAARSKPRLLGGGGGGGGGGGTRPYALVSPPPRPRRWIASNRTLRCWNRTCRFREMTRVD